MVMVILLDYLGGLVSADTQSKSKQLSSPTTNVTKYETYVAMWKDNIRSGGVVCGF